MSVQVSVNCTKKGKLGAQEKMNLRGRDVRLSPAEEFLGYSDVRKDGTEVSFLAQRLYPSLQPSPERLGTINSWCHAVGGHNGVCSNRQYACHEKT